MKRTINKLGLTLVEIMVVVGIISLLVSIGVPGWLRTRDRARRDTCINNLRMIENAADQYRIDNNLPQSQSVNIVSLWPATANAKDIASYVSKQLSCPIAGSSYVGGTYTAGSHAAVAGTTITANGLPHCVSSGTTITNNGTDLEHSIESDS